MPARAPTLSDLLLTTLQALDANLRAQRARLGINAVAAAESAGMSRWTWSRIEAGGPSVTMGAYLSAAKALGLDLELGGPHQADAPTGKAPLETVQLKRHPQLQRLAWQQPGTTKLTAQQALGLYERNWRHVDTAGMEPQERALVEALVKNVGGGRPLV